MVIARTKINDGLVNRGLINTTARGAIMSFEATLSGYINLAIAHEGTCDVYADGVLLGSVDPLGAERVANGTFDSATNGWTAVNSILSVASGQLNVADNGSYSVGYQGISVENGRYRLTYTAVSITGGTFVVGYGTTVPDGATMYADNIVLAIGTPNTYASNISLPTGITNISLGSTSTFAAMYDNVSLQKLYGITSVYATRGQRVDLVFSNPETVTYINMDGARLRGDVSQFSQFSNLQELTLPNMDPTDHIVDTELVVDGAFPAALTNWTAVETGGTVSVSGGVITVARTNGATSAGQTILTKGSVYTAQIHVTATSGTVQIQDNDGAVIKSITAVGTQDVTFFSQAATGQINVVAVSDGASVSFNVFSVKAITNEVANGGFDAWTGVPTADTPTGWTVSGDDPAYYITQSVAGGQARLVTDGTYIYLITSPASSVVVGTQYRFSISVPTVTSGTLKVQGTAVYRNIASSGNYQFYFTADATSWVLGRASVGVANDITFDNVLLLPWPTTNIGTYASLPTSLTTLNINGASNLAWTTGALNAHTLLTTITIDGANLTVDEINSFFASLVINEAAGSAARDCTVTLTNVPRPTGQGLTDATTTLPGKGWTVSIPAS
jgi:hypothetical protein